MAEKGKAPFGLLAFIAVATGLGFFFVAFMLTNIFERKQEGRSQILHVVELTDDTADPAIWGKNFPLHYDDYLKTSEMGSTVYGGSEAIPQPATDYDPRDYVARSKLERIPQLKRMWAGYAFSIDHREARGHAYMLEDQLYTERQKVGQPGACVNCHASTYNAMKELGEGDIHLGFEKLNVMPFDEAKEFVTHPVACIDCHDAETMALRITRPAFMEGIKVAKAHEGIENYDVNTMASRHEMRSYVCAQCHVEYYFHGDEKTLTFPWHNGLTVDGAYEYFDEIGFSDWTHAETGASMLKAQHPEFELWSQGIHARSGVTCADCHMPYKRVGGTKISDHHVRSPLLNVNNACGTCHKYSDEELKDRAVAIQTRHEGLVKVSLDALVDLIDDLIAAKDAGATDEELAEAREYQRRASFYVDYIEAENSSGFHASQEAARILGEAINFSRLGQTSLRGLSRVAEAVEDESEEDDDPEEDGEESTAEVDEA